MNFHLEKENEQMLAELNELKAICSQTSSLNVQYKTKLEEASVLNDTLTNSNKNLKIQMSR